jgi:nitrogen-specific signal transduction histidine kinase/ActR/RegA family two-component response regulator
MRDITKRRRTEEILKEKEEQLHQAQKMEAIGRLAGGVAHDFNNILTAVNGYAELLLMQLPPGGPEHQEVHEIRQAVARAASLTRQLLAFSRKQVIQPQALNLNQVVMSLEGMLRRLLGEDIDLALSLGEGLGLVLADPGQMEQVVLNLAVNARDAMPRGGKLHLETADVDLDEVFARPRLEVEPGSYVLLAVSDTGIGMDEAARSRIFEPFYTTKELGKGTGLGLSTVYGIVKQNRGHIWVYSEPGQGTTFKIYLPRMAPLADVAKISVKPAVLPRGWETVLLVEDDEMVRQVTSKMLQRQGYRVLEAAGGLEALKVCDSHREPVHLILTDVVMPGISGPEMAARAIQKHPGIKVLFMSGHTENTIVHHGVLEPGVAFLQKPFKYNDLICRVREVLDRTGECGVSGDYREPQN